MYENRSWMQSHKWEVDGLRHMISRQRFIWNKKIKVFSIEYNSGYKMSHEYQFLWIIY